jgi:hypothetical protein
LESWSVGVLACWRVGVLEPRVRPTGRLSAPHETQSFLPVNSLFDGSSLRVVLAPRPGVIPGRSFPPTNPLRDLCGRRAMLSSRARFSHPGPVVSLVEVSPTNPNPHPWPPCDAFLLRSILAPRPVVSLVEVSPTNPNPHPWPPCDALLLLSMLAPRPVVSLVEVSPTNPNPHPRPPCDAFLLALDSRTQAGGVPGRSFAHQPQSPSVTSVASVRCFPFAHDSRTQAAVSLVEVSER